MKNAERYQTDAESLHRSQMASIEAMGRMNCDLIRSEETEMTKDRALSNCELDVINNSRGSKIPKLIRKPDNIHFCHTPSETKEF